MSGAAALYTPAILELATSLTRFPLDPDLPLRGSARSKSCGSTLELGLALGDQGEIERLGMRTQACAIGQAAAAIFAQAAMGRTASDIAQALHDIRAWLTDNGALPDWPGFALLEPARAFPARHGAILLAWQAARDLLPTGALPG